MNYICDRTAKCRIKKILFITRVINIPDDKIFQFPI